MGIKIYRRVISIERKDLYDTPSLVGSHYYYAPLSGARDRDGSLTWKKNAGEENGGESDTKLVRIVAANIGNFFNDPSLKPSIERSLKWKLSNRGSAF